MRATLIAVLLLAFAAPVAFGHPERHAYFPDGGVGAVPKYRTTADLPTKTASQATCSTWDPFNNPDPPGCDWFTRPKEPK